MDDLEQAIRYALEPLTPHGGFDLCALCGVMKPSHTEHQCRTEALDLPGLPNRDGKARARSYAID